MALHEVAYFFHDGLEDVFDLPRSHGKKSRVEASCLVIRQSGKTGIVRFDARHEACAGDLRDVLLMLRLVFIEVALDRFLKIFEAHLPSLAFLVLHLIEPCLPQSTPYVLFKSVVKKGTSTQTTSTDGRLFDPQRFQRHDFVCNQTVTY